MTAGSYSEPTRILTVEWTPSAPITKSPSETCRSQFLAIFEAHTADATVVGANQIDELRFERDFGAGLLRGIDQQPINYIRRGA